MSLEKAKNAWVSAGELVVDLSEKVQAALIDPTVTEDKMKELKAQLDSARAKRDIAKEEVIALEAEQVANIEKEPLNKEEDKVKATFIQDFKAMVKGNPQVVALISSDTDESGNAVGLTIPEDIQTTIHSLVRQFDSLQEYVNVEKVTTSSGSRVYEKLANMVPLTELSEEDGVIPDNDDPMLYVIKYLIKRYSGINTLTNSLLKDTAENIIAWLTSWISKKVVVTRNAKILSVLTAIKAEQQQEITDVDGFKDVINVKLDPAISSTSMYLTNQSGYNALDKLKDENGNYLLQKDVTSATGYTFLGLPIKKMSNRFVPNIEDGKFPMFIGDLKEAVTLFDREQMSLLTTNIGGGAFETDTTKIRVIDRFDVKLVDDEAVVYATFSEITEPPAK